VIYSGIHQLDYNSNNIQSDSHKSDNANSSVADELAKLAKLKEQGVITEEEFAKLKKDVLDGKR
jgi:hypothetical protein